MSSKKIIYLFLLIFISFNSFSQKDSIIEGVGDSLASINKWEEAITHYKKIEANNIIFFKIAKMYSLLREDLEAKKYLDLSINMDSSYARAYCLRGVINRFIGETIASYNDLNKAIELNKNYALAFFYRGQFKLLDNNFENSLLDFDEAISNEETGESYYYRGVCKSAMGMHHEACEDYIMAKKMNYNKANLLIKELCE